MAVRVCVAIALCLGCSSTPNNETPIDGCASADFVPANQITWDFTVTPRCVEVHVGDSVTWTGDFATHPLQADEGDKPNPIASADLAGPSTTVAFPAAGTFGFRCQVHASMIGAVLVTP